MLTAYCLLATVTVSILLADAYRRRALLSPLARYDPGALIADIPFPITPLAQSPFPRAQKLANEALFQPEAHAPRETAGPTENHVAPSGVSFLRVPIQAETASGPKSFRAGTPVQILRRQDDKVEVTRDGADFFVRDWQIGSDPKVAGPPAHSSS